MQPKLGRSSVRPTHFNGFLHLGHAKNSIIPISKPMRKRYLGDRFSNLQQSYRPATSIGVRYLQRAFSSVDLDGPMCVLFDIKTRVKADHRPFLEFQERVKMS